MELLDGRLIKLVGRDLEPARYLPPAVFEAGGVGSACGGHFHERVDFVRRYVDPTLERAASPLNHPPQSFLRRGPVSPIRIRVSEGSHRKLDEGSLIAVSRFGHAPAPA